ncbi:hypothetical protein ALC62_15151, partial [Cyphomyrmex costatus]
LDQSHYDAGHMIVILSLRQFRNFLSHIQKDNALDSSKYPSLLLFCNLLCKYINNYFYVFLDYIVHTYYLFKYVMRPFLNTSSVIVFCNMRNKTGAAINIHKMLINNTFKVYIKLISAICKYFPQFSMPPTKKFGIKTWSIFVYVNSSKNINCIHISQECPNIDIIFFSEELRRLVTPRLYVIKSFRYYNLIKHFSLFNSPRCSRNNCFLKEEANLPQGKVIARNAVPLGPPTSPSKPGNNGITTNTLNTAPSLCALRILLNNVSPI